MQFSPEGNGDDHTKTVPISRDAINEARRLSTLEDDKKRAMEADPTLVQQGEIALQAAKDDYAEKMNNIVSDPRINDKRAVILNINNLFEGEVEQMLDSKYISTKAAENAKKEMAEVVSKCFASIK